MELSNSGANIQQGMAIYRKPGATMPDFCVGPWHTTPAPSGAGVVTFCLQPFSRTAPLSWLGRELVGQGWQHAERIWHSQFPQLPTKALPTATTRGEFVEEVLGIQRAIEQQRLQKAVAARISTVEKTLSPDSIWTSFMALHTAYPAAFVFLIIHPTWGCWMGATPETLIRVDETQATIMSLAGTLTQNQLEWTHKEALEQSVTSVFIQEVLARSGISGAKESAVGELVMGDVRHLMSEWQFNLPTSQHAFSNHEGANEPSAIERVVNAKDSNRHTPSAEKPLMNLIRLLHPTPAVGGYPQAEALDWLAQNEVVDRQLYTGFVGLMGDMEADFYVTLRCARLFQTGYALYAGCGVNAGSDPDIEWEETAAKMNLLGRFL